MSRRISALFNKTTDVVAHHVAFLSRCASVMNSRRADSRSALRHKSEMSKHTLDTEKQSTDANEITDAAEVASDCTSVEGDHNGRK